MSQPCPLHRVRSSTTAGQQKDASSMVDGVPGGRENREGQQVTGRGVYRNLFAGYHPVGYRLLSIGWMHYSTKRHV